jgi:hypothetical protein
MQNFLQESKRSDHATIRSQGDQMSLLKNHPKCSPTRFLPKLTHKFWATSVIFKKIAQRKLPKENCPKKTAQRKLPKENCPKKTVQRKLPKENNRQISEKSPNLVTLFAAGSGLAFSTLHLDDSFS